MSLGLNQPRIVNFTASKNAMSDDKKVEETKKVEDRSAYIQKHMPEGFVKKATSFCMDRS